MHLKDLNELKKTTNQHKKPHKKTQNKQTPTQQQQ